MLIGSRKSCLKVVCWLGIVGFGKRTFASILPGIVPRSLTP